METVTLRIPQVFDTEETLMHTYTPRELASYITKLRQERSTSQTEHAQDIDLIGQQAMEMADDLGWCDRYDSFVEELNGRLHISLPTRNKEYEARVRVTVYLSATITASCETEAKEEIENMFDRHELSYDGSDFEIHDTDIDAIEAVEQ